jgi:hypothetical protein
MDILDPELQKYYYHEIMGGDGDQFNSHVKKKSYSL